MGTWIRSQDKETLANIVSVFIDQKNNICGYDGSGNDVDNYYALGNYSSKEKAIKVLDMIQEHIENQNNYFENLNVGTEYGGLIVTQKQKVFNMPLDEEAEV